MPVVNPNPSQFQIMDFGRAASVGLNIAGQRQRNEALGMEIEEQKDMLRNRARAQEIRQQFEGVPAQLDEMESEGMFDQADELRDSWMRQAHAEVGIMEAVREGVNEDNYDAVRQGLLAEGTITKDLWPDEYSDDWFRKQVDGKKSTMTKLTRRWAEEGIIMTQDFVQRDGNIIWEGEPFEDPDEQAEGTGSKFSFKASDSNALARQAERLFGTFDPQTGRYALLDKTQSAKVAAIQEEAERLYKENRGELTHGQAMAQAARKAGITVQSLEQSQNTNPLNLDRPDTSLGTGR
jgi:hypothetical protein